jgi:hypothetical protein
MQVNRRKIIQVVKVTNAVLAQTCMGVFFICSISDTTFAMFFLTEQPADCHRPHGKPPQTTGGVWTTI